MKKFAKVGMSRPGTEQRFNNQDTGATRIECNDESTTELRSTNFQRDKEKVLECILILGHDMEDLARAMSSEVGMLKKKIKKVKASMADMSVRERGITLSDEGNPSEEWKKEIEAVKKEVDALRLVVEKQNETFSMQQDKNTEPDLAARVSQLEQDLCELKGRVDEQGKLGKSFQDENDEMRKSIEGLRNSLGAHDSEARLADLEREVTELKSRESHATECDLDIRVSKLETQLNELRKNDRSKEIDEIQAYISDRKQFDDEENELLNQCLTSTSSISEDIAKIFPELQDLKDSLARQERVTECLQENNALLESRIDSLGSPSTSGCDLSAIEDRFSPIEAQLNELRKNDRSKEIDEIQAYISDRKQFDDEENELLNQCLTSTSSISEDIAKIFPELQRLKDSFARQESLMDDLQEKDCLLESRIDSLGSPTTLGCDLSAIEDHVSTLEAELNELRKNDRSKEIDEIQAYISDRKQFDDEENELLNQCLTSTSSISEDIAKIFPELQRLKDSLARQASLMDDLQEKDCLLESQMESLASLTTSGCDLTAIEDRLSPIETQLNEIRKNDRSKEIDEIQAYISDRKQFDDGENELLNQCLTRTSSVSEEVAKIFPELQDLKAFVDTHRALTESLQNKDSTLESRIDSLASSIPSRDDFINLTDRLLSVERELTELKASSVKDSVEKEADSLTEERSSPKDLAEADGSEPDGDYKVAIVKTPGVIGEEQANDMDLLSRLHLLEEKVRTLETARPQEGCMQVFVELPNADIVNLAFRTQRPPTANAALME